MLTSNRRLVHTWALAKRSYMISTWRQQTRKL